jgi:hypothetical protein
LGAANADELMRKVHRQVRKLPDELMVRFEKVPKECKLQALKLLDESKNFAWIKERLIVQGELSREIKFASPPDPVDQVKLEVGQLKAGIVRSAADFVHEEKFLLQIGDADKGLLARVLDLLGVSRIDPFEYATLRNGTTAGVIQSGSRDDRSLFRRRRHGAGQVLGLIDDFLDTDHCFLDDPQGALPGPHHRKLVGYRPDLSAPPSLHGTFVAGILAGSSSKNLREQNNGQAPEAMISFDSVWDFAARGPVRSVLYQTLQDLYCEKCDDGARIFSNSWGDKERGWYTYWAYDIDRFSCEREDALVLFAVNNDERVLSPENAKNVLAVGASKQADLHEYVGRAGQGPTCDGQRKPEIFAPGCQIRSAVAGTRCGVGQAPVQQHLHHSAALSVESTPLHVSSCATSWACPAVAGAAALARQHLGTPSGALLRATLLNGTRDMTGEPGYPSNAEGWGRLVLDDALFFAGEPRRAFMADVRNDLGFEPEDPARVRRYRIRVTNGALSLKATLAWTDPPPAVIERRNPLVNDLDLRVQKLTCSQGENCYFLGNAFESGFSQAFPTRPDHRADPNNVEQVLINNPSGVYCVSVVGEKIHVPRQGYALVVTGGITLEPADDCPAGALSPERPHPPCRTEASR